MAVFPLARYDHGMSAATEINRAIRAILGPQSLVDWPTAVVIATMAAGFPLLIWGHHAGGVPLWAAFPLAVLLMNLSFTAWHEPAHGNFSRKKRLNDVAGWIASAASVYPAYFARRQEHLIHHQWEGIPGRDPVFPRIQTTLWRFPFRLARLALNPPPQPIPPALARTPRERAADAASHAVVLGAAAASVAWGFWPSLLWLWIVPRFLIFWVHAFVICFFPHAVAGGGYTVARVREGNRLLRFATVGQNFHGIHHRWPFIPWHRYARVLAACRDAIVAQDIQFVPKKTSAARAADRL